MSSNNDNKSVTISIWWCLIIPVVFTALGWLTVQVLNDLFR